MHELALMEDLTSVVLAATEGLPVKVVRLEVGSLSAVAIDALRFSFDICARDTRLAHATLEIVETPATATCRACGTELAIRSWLAECACGSTELEIIGGRELKILEVEVC